MHTTGRAGAVAGLAASTLLPAVALLCWTPGTVRSATMPGADVSTLLAAGALLLAWLVVARLTVTFLAVLVAVLPGAVGATAGRVAAAVTPRLLRSAVRVACGAAVAGAPVVGAGSALADPVVPAIRLVAPAQLPLLDRVAVEAVRPTRPVPVPAGAVGLVVVRSGDTLWRIADRELGPGHTDADVARAWPRWYTANVSVIGPDPALIRPGEELRRPAVPGGAA